MPQFNIDARIAAVLALRPDCVPGELRLHGPASCYDLDLRGAWVARRAVREAPHDLAALSDAALTGLHYAALRRDADCGYRDPQASDLLARTCAERTRRKRAAA